MWFWTKPILRSKTFWLAVLGSAAQITGILTEILPEDYVPITIALQGTLHVWCRFFTRDSVSLTGE